MKKQITFEYDEKFNVTFEYGFESNGFVSQRVGEIKSICALDSEIDIADYLNNDLFDLIMERGFEIARGD